MSSIPLLIMSLWSNWMAPPTWSTPSIQLPILEITHKYNRTSFIYGLARFYPNEKHSLSWLVKVNIENIKSLPCHIMISLFPIMKSLKTFLFFISQCTWLTHFCASWDHFKTHYQRLNVFEYDFTVKGFQSMIIIFHCLLIRIYISKMIVGYRTLILSFKHKMRPLNLINFLEATCSLRNKIYP